MNNFKVEDVSYFIVSDNNKIVNSYYSNLKSEII